MDDKPKQIVMVGEMLTDIRMGIYTQWVWYSDGTMEVKKIPKGPVLMIPPIIV